MPSLRHDSHFRAFSPARPTGRGAARMQAASLSSCTAHARPMLGAMRRVRSARAQGLYAIIALPEFSIFLPCFIFAFMRRVTSPAPFAGRWRPRLLTSRSRRNFLLSHALFSAARLLYSRPMVYYHYFTFLRLSSGLAAPPAPLPFFASSYLSYSITDAIGNKRYACRSDDMHCHALSAI